MSRLFNPYALTALGKPLQQRQPPELRVETPYISRAQLDMAQHAFVRFLDQARLSRVPNPTQQGRLADGTPYRIVTASGAPIMQVWPVTIETSHKEKIKPGILIESESGVVYLVGFNKDKNIWEWGYNKYALFGHMFSPIMNGDGYFTYSLKRDDYHPAAYIATSKVSDKVNPDVLRIASSDGYIIESDIPLPGHATPLHVMGHIFEDEIKYVFVRALNNNYSIWVSGAGDINSHISIGNGYDVVKKPKLYGEFQLPIDLSKAQISTTSSGEFLFQIAEPTNDNDFYIVRSNHGKHHVWKIFSDPLPESPTISANAYIDSRKLQANAGGLVNHVVSITGVADKESDIFFVSGLQPYGYRKESFYTCEHDASSAKIILEEKNLSPPELIGTRGYRRHIDLPTDPLRDYNYIGYPLTCIAIEMYYYKYRNLASTTLEEKKDCVINAGYYTNFKGDLRQIKFRISGDSSKRMSEAFTSSVSAYAGNPLLSNGTSWQRTESDKSYEIAKPGVRDENNIIYSGITTTVPRNIVIDCEVVDKLRHTVQVGDGEIILLDCDLSLTCKMSSDEFLEARLDECNIGGVGYLSRTIVKFHPELDLLCIAEVILSNIKVGTANGDSPVGSIINEYSRYSYSIPVFGVRSIYFCFYVGGKEIYRELVVEEVFESSVLLMGHGNIGLKNQANHSYGVHEKGSAEIKVDLGNYIKTEIIHPEYTNIPGTNDWPVTKKGSYTVSEDPVVSPDGTFVKNYYKSARHEIDWLEYKYNVLEKGGHISPTESVNGVNVERVDTCRGLPLNGLFPTHLITNSSEYLNYDVAIDPESKGFAIMGSKFKLLVSPDHKVTHVEDLKGLSNVDFNDWCASV